jgi:hypothetical protein
LTQPGHWALDTAEALPRVGWDGGKRRRLLTLADKMIK